MDDFEYQGVPTNDPTRQDGAVHIFRSNAISYLVECCLGAHTAETSDLVPELALELAREDVAEALLEHLEHPSHEHPSWYNADIASYIIRDIDKSININRDRWKTFMEMALLPGDTLVFIISVTGKIR